MSIILYCRASPISDEGASHGAGIQEIHAQATRKVVRVMRIAVNGVEKKGIMRCTQCYLILC